MDSSFMAMLAATHKRPLVMQHRPSPADPVLSALVAAADAAAGKAKDEPSPLGGGVVGGGESTAPPSSFAGAATSSISAADSAAPPRPGMGVAFGSTAEEAAFMQARQMAFQQYFAMQQRIAVQHQLALHQMAMRPPNGIGQMAVQPHLLAGHPQAKRLREDGYGSTLPREGEDTAGPAGERPHKEGGRWALWVLELKVRERNTLAEERSLTQSELADLKVETKRHQRALAQRKYHKKRAMAAGKSYGRPGRPRTRGVADRPKVSEEMNFRGKKKKERASTSSDTGAGGGTLADSGGGSSLKAGGGGSIDTAPPGKTPIF